MPLTNSKLTSIPIINQSATRAQMSLGDCNGNPYSIISFEFKVIEAAKTLSRDSVIFGTITRTHRGDNGLNGHLMSLSNGFPLQTSDTDTFTLPSPTCYFLGFVSILPKEVDSSSSTWGLVVCQTLNGVN